MGTYRNLIAWQRSMDLVDAIYKTVALFPRPERFVLSEQMRRAAVSIPSNIAEGCGRYSRAEERHFFRQARGSAYELRTQIEIATRQRLLHLPHAKDLMRQAEQVGRLINGLLTSLSQTPAAKPNR